MKKYALCLILTALSFVPLIVTAIIPYTTSTRLYVDNTTFYWERKEEYLPRNHVISLSTGTVYTIKFQYIPFTKNYVEIRIGDDPYMISGYEITTTTSAINKNIIYSPYRSGDHYIQVFGLGEGVYWITVEQGQTASPTEYIFTFFNGLYLLGLILPTTISAFVANLITLLAMRERPSSRKYKFEQPVPVYMGVVKKQAEMNKIKYCETCKTKFSKPFKYCPNCREQIN
ncbi:MAG: hypothetical protein ACFFAT_04310 [Promethearchaeota archaeon]